MLLKLNKDLPSCAGVYKITNTVNGKYYIGSTKHLKRRYFEHFSALKNGTHKNEHLQNSVSKYGISNFVFEVLETTDENTRLVREQYWIDKLDACNCKVGFNINRLATGGGLYGENNAMFGISPKERMNGPTYEKWLKARQGENASKPMQGKHHSAAAKEKISKSRIGTKHTEEWKKQHSQQIKGHKMPLSVCENISRAKLLNPSKNDVAVICTTTGNKYFKISDAARAMNVTKSAIFNAINGKSKTCCGMKWEYACE